MDKRKKHIMLIFHHYFTPGDMGGLRSWHIGSRLVREGYKVTAIVPGVDVLTGKKHPSLGMKPWSSEIINGARVIRVNSFGNDRRYKFKRALYYLNASVMQSIASVFVRKVDVVVSTAMPLTSVILAYINSLLRGVPYVADVRDLSTDMAIEMGYFRNRLFYTTVLALERAILKRAALCLPVSEGMGRLLVEAGVRPERVKPVPLGYDGKQAYEGVTDWDRDIKKELGLEGRHMVLYAGAMGNVIDIPVVLRAAALTRERKDIVYVFIGGGQMADNYRKQAEEEGLNCLFAGSVPKGDVPLFCTQADLGVYPLGEGRVVATMVGNKIYDYLGGGLPTVFSGPEGDVRQLLLRSGGGVHVPSGDADAVASEITRLLTEPETLARMRESARSFIEKEYDVSIMMTRFSGHINELLEREDDRG